MVQLVEEYPDIFTLSLSEVFPIDFMRHKLKINPDAVLLKKVHQRPITELQQEFFLKILDDMEKAGIIHTVPADFIKCLNTTHLAPKEADKGCSLSCDALLHICNEQCQQYGLPDHWEPVQTEEGVKMDQTTTDELRVPPKKWRVCQAFHTVNAAMQIPVFPSSDLKAKQQKVAGK